MRLSLLSFINIWDKFEKITPQQALDNGLTHEGFLYGVHVYLINPFSHDIGIATARPVFKNYVKGIDNAVDFLLNYISADFIYFMPIKDVTELKIPDDM